MSEPFTIESTDSPSADDITLLRRGLDRFNRTAGGFANFKELTLFVRDANAQVVGGLIGYSLGSCLHIQTLWVHEQIRAGGVGSRLLTKAEEIASARGCEVVDLKTFSFQAPAFYKKHGYVAFAELGGVGGNHTAYFFKKVLAHRVAGA